MYAITIIRLDPDTKVFQNTETNSFVLEEDVRKKLIDMGCDQYNLHLFEDMAKASISSRFTFEAIITAGIDRGIRFAYVFKIY